MVDGSTCKVIGTIVLNIGRYTGVLADIPIFYPKRYDKCKNLSDIVLGQYELIYRHVTNKSTDIRDEISDISSDIVTYLDNFFCLRDRFIYSMFIAGFQ